MTDWLDTQERTRAFLELVVPVGHRFVERIDATAGPNWMPAARERRAAAVAPLPDG